jgi:hypothetical protein
MKQKYTRLSFLVIAAMISMVLPFLFLSIHIPESLFSGIWQSLFVYVMFFVVFPLVFVRFVLKESISRFGFRFARISRREMVLMFGLLGITIVLFWGVVEWFGVHAAVSAPEFVSSSFWLFFLYFFLLQGMFGVFYEIFFRGFLLIGIVETLGFWSILLSLGAFWGFLFASGTFGWENFSIIVGSISASIVAYKTRSLVWSFLFSFLFGILASIVITI